MMSDRPSRVTSFCFAACIVLGLLLGGGRAAVAAAGWKAGASKVNITPQEPLWMAGYAARTHAADGKLTDLWAKALWLEDARGKAAVLVTLDLIGLDRAMSGSICRRLQQQFGLQRDQIALCPSHTHSGPVVAQNLRPLHLEQLDEQQRAAIVQYAAALEESLLQLVAQAQAARQEVQLSWGSGRAPFAVNRRNNREAEVTRSRSPAAVWSVRSITMSRCWPCELPKGICWPWSLATLAMRRCWTDTSGAVIIRVTRSWPSNRRTPSRSPCSGPAAAPIRIRCRGAVWRWPSSMDRHWPRRYSTCCSNPWNRLKARWSAATPRSICRWTRCRAGSNWSGMRRMPIATWPRARLLLAQWDAGQAPAATYPYPIAHWRLGSQITWVFLGGEVVVDYALTLKAGTPHNLGRRLRQRCDGVHPFVACAARGRV